MPGTKAIWVAVTDSWTGSTDFYQQRRTPRTISAGGRWTAHFEPGHNGIARRASGRGLENLNEQLLSCPPERSGLRGAQNPSKIWPATAVSSPWGRHTLDQAHEQAFGLRVRRPLHGVIPIRSSQV